MQEYYIYKATNIVNNKAYIGFTSNFNTRKFQHEWLSENRKDKSYFHKALKKYGKENFKWEIVYKSYDKINTHKKKEPYYIKHFNTYAPNGYGYNLSKGGDGGGQIRSNQWRERQSATRLSHPRCKELQTKATEAARIANTGKKQTEEHIKKRIQNKQKKVIINGVHYTSLKEAAEDLSLHASYLTILVKENGYEFDYVKKTNKFKCPYCSKGSNNIGSLKRWHFENCKNKA